MELKKVFPIVMAVIGLIVLVLVLSTPNGWIIGILGIFCMTGIYLLNRRKEDLANPVLEWKMRIIESCRVQTVKLGDLVTLGGYDYEGKEITAVHQETHFGRILGFTKATDGKAENLKFKRIMFFTVKAKGIRGIFPFSLFVQPDVYAVFPHQLDSKEFTRGMNICIKGATWSSIEGVFYLNDTNITPSEIMTNLKKQVEIITLGRYFEKLPAIIDNAVEANGTFKQQRGLKDGVI